MSNTKSYYHVVMTSQASMPNSCWGRYGNVAIVRVKADHPPPKIIRDTNTAKVVWHSGPQNMGTTERCAFERTLVEAYEECERLNG